MTSDRVRWLCRVLAVPLALAGAVAQAQPTAFTYQGELHAGDAPAEGSFDLRFGLFAQAAGGAAIGSPQTVAAVPVSGGVFTVQLDFGVDAFPGANRFVEVAVRPAGGGAFTSLAPRQQISSAPYAIRTLLATNAERLGGLPASRYVQATAEGDVGIGTAGATNGKLAVNGGSRSAVYGESTTARGVWGKSVSSRGVYGESESFQGVFGTSQTQAGVAGESGSFHGVFGSAHGVNSAGVYGTNDAGGFGVTGVSTAGANGVGVQGESATGSGVRGRSVTGPGVQGIADSGSGVVGESTSAHAVVGRARAASRAGVAATNDAAGGLGVQAVVSGLGGVGVYAECPTGRGVWGKSVSSRGVYGESDSLQGVFGISNSSAGVHGESAGGNAYGVYGRNLNGFAMGAEGHVTQNRDRGGWVKALLYIGADGTILRCYNSFRPGAAATAGNCGFAVERVIYFQGGGEVATFDVTFPFRVNDRFLSATAEIPSSFPAPVASFDFSADPNNVLIALSTQAADRNAPAWTPVMLVVF